MPWAPVETRILIFSFEKGKFLLRMYHHGYEFRFYISPESSWSGKAAIFGTLSQSKH
jgi:hypothetical protein